MPNFKEFIKGFEEPEQPKENRDQIIEKVNRKMMNANTYGALGDKENYEKSIAEAEELRKGLAPKAEPKPHATGEQLGASKGMAQFLRNAETPETKYRVRYGYINENKLGDHSNSKFEDVKDYQAALDRYKELDWLKDKDEKGRRFVTIETSNDDWKSEPGKLFFNSQRGYLPRENSFEKVMRDFDEKPEPIAPEQAKAKLDEEIGNQWEYIYEGESEERIAEIAAERTGIPLEQVKAYLKENPIEKPEE